MEGKLPSLAGATGWLNSPPLTAESLRGQVVLVDFWTYSCINCLRALPYVKRWYDTYREHGLVVIGVHAPEFAFERDPDNVRRAVTELAVRYPVAIDDDYAIWRGFNNQYWPAHYFIDTSGQIRAHHFGEGDYAESETVIRELLTEAGHKDLPPRVIASDLHAARHRRHRGPGGSEGRLIRRNVHRLPARLGVFLTGWICPGPDQSLSPAAGASIERVGARRKLGCGSRESGPRGDAGQD